MHIRKQVFISVKYNHDQVIERSLTAFLKKERYETYHHDGTADLLDHVNLMPLIDDGHLKIFIPSQRQKKKNTPSSGVSTQLIHDLIEVVSSYPVVIVIWSSAYAASFWCMLELQTALQLQKPMVIIHCDNSPLLPDFLQSMRSGTCKIINLDKDYKTTMVLAMITQLYALPSDSVGSEQVLRDLGEFSSKNFDENVSYSGIGYIELDYYEKLLMVLFNADNHGELQPAIAHLVGVRALEYNKLQGETLKEVQLLMDAGLAKLDAGFRGYLEDIALGLIERPNRLIDDRYCMYLLGEILDYQFLAPRLPQNLEDYYLKRIAEALTPAQAGKIEHMIDDLIQNSLFTREFVEHFFNSIHVLSKSGNTGSAFTGKYIELCKSRFDEAV